MASADYPDTLKLSAWEKKKDSLPKGHEVGDQLKAPQKKHEVVAWKTLEPAAWAKSSKSVQELEQAFAQAERLYRTAAMGLKRDAGELAAAAARMGKDKAPASLALHKRQSGRSMFATLVKSAGVKTGSHGAAWMPTRPTSSGPDSGCVWAANETW